MLVIEDIIGRCAPLLGIDPAELRRRNFYVDGPGDAVRPAGPPPRAAGRGLGPGLGEQPTSSAPGRGRRRTTPSTRTRKRGLAITPVKFGISFNFTTFNQAGALVHVYKDGSVLINHGGTEMGQGLHTKMLQVAATALGLPLEKVRLAPTRTDKVPNTSATAASAGADLNGGAIKDACEQILGPAGAGARPGTRTRRGRSWSAAAYHQRIQLWAAGFYKTEGLSWDLATMTGHAVQVLRLRRRGRRGRGRRLHRRLPRPGGSTSSTTSATASRRWSTSARSRAGSCRAPAG